MISIYWIYTIIIAQFHNITPHLAILIGGKKNMSVQQNSDYEVVSFAEVSSIITHFTPGMIEDVIDRAISDKELSFVYSKPNIPEAIESTFVQALQKYPQFSQDINSARTQTYESVIAKLCSVFELTYIGDESTDRYTSALIMYDFFVSCFDKYIVEFIYNAINTDRETYYEYIMQSENRVETSPYIKKMFKKDNKISTIVSNIPMILSNIITLDTSIYDIIQSGYGPLGKNYSLFLSNIIEDRGDFYVRMCVPFIRYNNASISTSLSFRFQSLSDVDMSHIVHGKEE